MPHLVKSFWGNVSTVLPEDGLVEAELDELVFVAQLATAYMIHVYLFIL